jgi:hypothetical protein
MELEYEFTLDDQLASLKYQAQRSRAGRRTPTAVFIVWATLAALAFPVYHATKGPGTPGSATLREFLTCTAVVLGVLLLQALVLAVIRSRHIRQTLTDGENKALYCTHALAIRPDCLTDETSLRKYRWAWEAIEAIEEDENHVFIYITAVSALPIPKRAFQNQRHAQLFLDEARRFKAQA